MSPLAARSARAGAPLLAALLTVGVVAVVGPTAPAAAQPAPVVAARPAAPQPHPVAPKMQVLRPRGVDQHAMSALRTAARTTTAAGSTAALAGTAPALVTAPTATSPFQLVGLTWAAKGAPAGITIDVRLREQGRWGSWQTLGVEDAGPDPDTAEGRRAAATAGSDPLLSDGADGVQVVVHTATGKAPAGLKVDLINAGTSAADGEPAAAPAPAQAQTTAATTAATTASRAGVAASAVRAAPRVAGQPSALGTASPMAVNSAPAIITRAQWGADESIRKPVDFNTTVKAMVIHHTDTTNSYTTLAQAEQQVRAVYAFHVEGRGWSDIGYNFVVDRFGHIFEGRAGSITKSVLGAHTGGFNTYTMGVAALGTFTTAAPPAAMVSSIAQVVAWKMSQYGANVNGTVSLRSSGGGTSRYPAGTVVTVPTVTGHRTFGATECPGDALWAQLGSIRSQAAAIVAREPVGTGYTPVTGVWWAGGPMLPAWYRAGYWWIPQANGTTRHVHFGVVGDFPVVGDWDGDGVTGLGVYASGTWYVTNQLPAGDASIQGTWQYGGAGMLPLVGVWPGTTTLGIGVNKGNVWSFRSTMSAGSSLTGFTYGQIGDEPIAADWDGDGSTTPGVLRLGQKWYLIQSLVASSRETVIPYGTFLAVASAGDWDGNGSVTPAAVKTDRWLSRNDLNGGASTVVKYFAPS